MPITCPDGNIYTVKKGDTLYKIALRFGLTVDQLIKANPQLKDPNSLKVGQKLCIPTIDIGVCPGMAYVIQTGDTLYNIARKFGVSVGAITRANPGIEPDNLIIGERICIPVVVKPLRPTCKLLSPTDNTPNSKGFLFIEPDVNSVLAGVSGVPNPTTLPGGELYKIWILRRGTNTYAVGVLTEEIPDVYIGKIVPEFPITQAGAVLITSERAENITAPTGLAVATGRLL